MASGKAGQEEDEGMVWCQARSKVREYYSSSAKARDKRKVGKGKYKVYAKE